MPGRTTALETPALPCPECRLRGLGGGARIGNRRNRCTTCNNFAQNVMRLTRSKLKEMFSKEYEQIRARVELDLYPQVMEDWLEAHPELDGRRALTDEEADADAAAVADIVAAEVTR